MTKILVLQKITIDCFIFLQENISSGLLMMIFVLLILLNPVYTYLIIILILSYAIRKQK